MSWTAATDRLCRERYLIRADAAWDEAWQLLAEPCRATYHTKLRSGLVHGLRPSIQYAEALLDTGEATRLARAEAIIDTCLAHQDTDPHSASYGIWPYYAEESLAEMDRPDWNWADFMGECLVGLLARHAARLAPDRRARIEAALRHANASIVKRNVRPDYTNICALGSFVTLATAELLDDDRLLAYAVARLADFRAQTEAWGSFREFNSPTYAVVTILALTKLVQVARHEAARADAVWLLERAWRHVADHWHPPTRQWAGPHSRAYTTDLRQNQTALLLLQKASGGQLEFYSEADLPGHPDLPSLPVADHAPPPEVWLTLPAPRQHVESFNPAEAPVMSVAGTTWLAADCALGSFNRFNLWNQSRPLLGYWGRPEAPVSLRLQALHDGRDFASAQVACAQEKGVAVALVNFGVDGGDWHPTLQKVIDQRFPATDLRVRLAIEGIDPTESPVRFRDGRWQATLAGVDLWVDGLGGDWSGEPARWEVTALEHGVGLDAVLWQAEAPATIDWRAVSAAWVALAVGLQTPPGLGQVTRNGPLATAEMTAGGAVLRVTGRTDPVPCGEQQRAFRVAVEPDA